MSVFTGCILPSPLSEPARPRYEEKKGAGGNVFPADMDVIPAFSVVEIMITPANQGGFEQGYGLQVCACFFHVFPLAIPDFLVLVKKKTRTRHVLIVA